MKTIKFQLVILAFLLAVIFNACSDDPVIPKRPAQVVIQNTTLNSNWYSLHGIGDFTLSGIAKNTGEKTAYHISIRLHLYNANNQGIASTNWAEILTSLSPNGQRSFTKIFAVNQKSYITDAKTYSVEVSWSESAMNSHMQTYNTLLKTSMKISR